MCGIIGYSGPENPKDILIEGLKKLEYRGYDSAGVTILDANKFKRVRAEGKLIHLENKIKDQNFDGHLGIAHTRWATHGVPIEDNAHPHKAGPINIVHNGIIENYATLKDQLISRGAKLQSDTDSEVVAHLIFEQTQKGLGLLKAIQVIIKKLEGAYALLIVSENEPDEIIAVKNGPPLILGADKNSLMVASDILALVPRTQNMIYLEDYEIAHIKENRWEVFDFDNKRLTKEVTQLNWTPDKVEKQGYSHFMLKEIYEQPGAVIQAITPHINLEKKAVVLSGVGFKKGLSPEEDVRVTNEVLKSVEKVFIVACGTSFYAGMLGKYIIEDLCHISVEVDFASEFRYRKSNLLKNSLVIVISQSGETADTLAALRMVHNLGIKTLSICNTQLSTIDREASGHIYMNAGVEIGVASTKALSCTISLLNLFALALSKAKEELPQEEEQKIIGALLKAPFQMETVLAYDKFFAKAASTLRKYKGFLYIGRGLSFPVSMEGALKLKELAYIHAEGYAAGEMKHGPLALVDKDMCAVVLIPKNDLYKKTMSNLEEVKARGGQVISIGTEEDEKLSSLSQHYLPLPKTHEFITPLLQLIPLQLLAFHVAQSMGYDVDQPRNLAKSVTVE